MKFAKELERDLVPEWRLKYLDYKAGKKKLTAITRALRKVNQTPRLRQRGTNTFTPSPFEAAPQYSFVNRDREIDRDVRPSPVQENGHKPSPSKASADLRALAKKNSQASLRSKAHGIQEEQPLNADEDRRFPRMTRYGSIIGSPPSHDGFEQSRKRAPSSLKLPGAALDLDGTTYTNQPASTTTESGSGLNTRHVQLPSTSGNAFEIGKTRAPHRKAAMTLPSRYKSVFTPKRVNSTPGVPTVENPRPFIKRVFSMSHAKNPNTPSPGDVPLEVYRDLDIRQAEFFQFLDVELDKIESFYKEKEEEATERLEVLRDQLHIMRDRRLDELISLQTAKMNGNERRKNAAEREPLMNGNNYGTDEDEPATKAKGNTLSSSWLNPLDTALEAVKHGKYGKSTKAMADLATPSGLIAQVHPDDNRDYTRRPHFPDVPYQSAKRKLKVAMQEYYRGLELLKSYALLNRTAFRKINKKYDKTVNARPSMRYMVDKVNKAWFVQSDVVDGHIRAVEDLYARYFEKGNHKVAVGKLRIKMARAGDFTQNSFRNGLMLAAGLVFGIQGLVYGAELLNSSNDKLKTDTSYLLQIYAGYFLINFLFILFCMACRVWHVNKINYVFVFEYDTRHHLDWRQLCELPCFFIFLLGLFMWVNFNQFGSDTMYLYYPTILLGVTALVILLPAPILYFRSRQWLVYSLWRLLLAGLYPVEFRDFYLGDMFCSLTYAMGNIELFFCLYAHKWGNPAQCNSSHSRLLGFFSALPGVWRALQCLRRYYDTRNVFPHLVNCGKYSATIVFYVVLSIYRLDKSEKNRALFITFATINSIYCIIWDVIMDWSLGDPSAKHKFLRPMLGYKKVWWYYLAMVIDPILRFNWIPYTVDPLQLQHSAVTSFVVALSEVFRRGMWTIFRVENEHCTNVGRFRASRDVPLPYEVSSPVLTAEDRDRRVPQIADHEPQQSPEDRKAQKKQPSAPQLDGQISHTASNSFAASADVEAQITRTRSSTSKRNRASPYVGPASQPSPLVRGITRVGTLLWDAHAQDFERKKKPELGAQIDGKEREDDDDSDDSDREAEDMESSTENIGAPGGTANGTLRESAEVQVEGEVARETEMEESERDIEAIREQLSIGRGESSGLGGVPERDESEGIGSRGEPSR